MYADVATLIKAYMRSEKVSSVPAFARKLRIPVKDVYVAPSDLLKRDDEKIYEKFSKYSDMYFAINKVINDLIKKYEEE